MSVISQIAYGVLSAILILAAVRLFNMPFRLPVKIVVNIAGGFIVLALFNLIGKPLGMTVGVSAVSVAAVAALGMPGFALLLMAQWLFR